MAQPTERGPVDIVGVTTRTNTTESRVCASEDCESEGRRIPAGVRYERVARDAHTFESYHLGCFEYEFGERRLYGD